MKTKKEAFSKFGIKQKNERWSWSGLNLGTSAPIDPSLESPFCVLTIWTDQKKFNIDSKIHYWSTFNCNNEIWKDKPGNIARINDIKFCLENLNGEFLAIFINPVKKGVFDEESRKIKSISINTRLWFKITRFDEKTGECEAESFLRD